MVQFHWRIPMHSDKADIGVKGFMLVGTPHLEEVIPLVRGGNVFPPEAHR